MSAPEVLVSTENGICHIQINRPEVKNALNQVAYQQLADAVTTANGDDTVRVLLISGNGGNFSSGNDLSDFAAGKGIGGASATLKFMNALLACEKPVIAAVSGFAVGIGTTLLLHCDLVYADSSATFCLPFNNLGICAEFASSLLLPRLAGRAKAMEIILLGEPFNAEVACEAGIICSVKEDALRFAKQQAGKLAKQPPQATRINKALLTAENKVQINAVMESELEKFAQCLSGEECNEALTAFKNKRPANFSRFK